MSDEQAKRVSAERGRSPTPRIRQGANLGRNGRQPALELVY